MRFLLSIVFLLLLPVDALSEDKGKQIYDQWCAQCHGYEGKGDGHAAEFTFPKPRDFTVGTYKFTSTPSGDPPTDEDLARMIRKGNQGTSMPAWTRFTDEEVRALAEHIKKFAPDIFSYKPEPIKISKAPSCTNEMIKEGAKAYKEVAKCWECHGERGRGNGKKSWDEKFKDDWGNSIYPGNQTHPWEHKKGSSLEDIYVTITTGNKGTPMTSYQDSLTDEERWALACFVKSRQLQRKLGAALRVKKVDAIPSATNDKIWEQVDYLDIPMAGQIIFEPRHFAPAIANARIRGVYTASEVAILLEWTDKKPNQGNDGLPADAIRVKFPSKLSEGTEKPHFYMGDKKREVKIWQWKASDGIGVELNAKGFRDLAQQEKQDIKATWTYEEGLYRVIFKRALDTKDQGAIVFEAGRFIPFSVGLYDGRGKEEENKGSISAWYYIMLDPPTPLKVYVLPPVVALVVLGLGMLLHKRLRTDRPSPSRLPPGTAPSSSAAARSRSQPGIS